MKRIIISVVASVMLAAVGTYFLVGFVRGAEARALAGQEVVEVLVLNENVARGTPAEDLVTAVSVEQIPAKVRANGSVTTLDQLGGLIATVDLVAGEQLVANRFATRSALEAASRIQVPEGMQEITLSLAPPRALGGNVRPGDTVGLFASFNLRDGRDENEIESEELAELRQRLSEASKSILHELLITNVQVEQLPQSAPDDTDGSTLSLAPTGNLLVTLAVDVPQAERIIFAAEYGSIWLSAQDENTNRDGSRIRTLRNIYDD